MCQEDKLTKGFSLFAPIGSCVSCAGHEETYFSHNFFSFLDKNSIHSTFIVRCLREKMGGDFQGVPPLCVYFSLCGGCIASAFVRSSGSRLSGIFFFFSFGQQMRSIALLPGDLFTNSRLCEICSTAVAASRFDASAVHETTSGAIPPGIV